MKEKQLKDLIDQGLSQRQISDALGWSQTTVRYWLGRYGLKTVHNRHNKVDYEGKYIQRECKKHGITTFIFEKSKNGYRCKKCRSGNVALQRRNLKKRLVEESGGKCQVCGYNKSIWALQFHHKNPAQKEREISHLIRDRKYSLAKQEVNKCDLLCANCHAEIEEQQWNCGVNW